MLANEFQQLRQLPREGAIGVGDIAQIGFQHGLRTEAIEQCEKALLGPRSFGRGPQFGQFSFESFCA